MTALISKLLKTLPVEPTPVRKIVIGVHWTMVCSQYAGLASTLFNCGPHGHSHMRDVGNLHQKSAQELAQWALSENLLEASVGIAALNSLIPVNGSQLKQMNASEIIARESKGKNLVIVGHFPFVERIKNGTKNCWVIEKRPYGDDFPEEASQEFMPQADMIAITGTALINHTIENLLGLCRPESRIMVLGPSTPLSPVLYDAGISYISGSRIFDEDAAALTIQQGASFPQVKGVQVVTMSNITTGK